MRQLVSRLRSHRWLLVMLLVALILRAALAPQWAYLKPDFTDENFWRSWMQAIHQQGLLNIFRTTGTDYVGYHYVLWLLDIAYGRLGGGSYDASSPSLHLLLKAPPILFDLALIVAVYAVSRSLFEELRASNGKTLALVAAAVIALQPAVLYDSAVWSQTDSAVTLAMLLALFLVARGRIGWGFAVWAAGFLVKPHPVIVLPLLLYMAWRKGGKKPVVGAVTILLVVSMGLLPWLLHGDAGNLLRVYHSLAGADYERLSASAWNLWWFFDITSQPKPEQVAFAFLTYRMIGLLLSAGAGLLALLYLRARQSLEGALVSAAYLAFAFYMLPVSTHERYLYPFLALLLPVAVVRARWRALFGAASLAFFVYLFVVAPPMESYAGRWVDSPLSVAVASLNCLLFALFTGALATVALPSAAALALPKLRRKALDATATPVGVHGNASLQESHR